ncbi:hypothetical protein UlMin_019310 [Ulmus minor]
MIIQENWAIKEEFNIWRNNIKFLYDLMIIKALEWPSLTVQWLPERDEPTGENYDIQKLILGTHAAANETNYLNIAEVKLPFGEAELHGNHPNEKIEITQKIKHDGEVHRARYMPQNSNMIANKSVNPNVYVFDISKHPTEADLKLTGHTAEGFSLSWSNLKHGHLLSGSYDGKICLWDVNVTPSNKTLEAKKIIKIHGEDGVQDVAWHLKTEHIFGSVGEDKYLHICDVRKPTDIVSTLSVLAHKNDVTSLAFNPHNEWIVATGSTDKTVKLFDIRKFHTPIHTLKSHREGVLQIGWNPKEETILASSDHCRRLLIWDLSRIGQIQTGKEAIEGPPELLFLHGGHTSIISDFSWNPSEDCMVASVAEDNIL